MKLEFREALSAPEIGGLSMMAKEIWNEYFPPLIGYDQVDYMLDKFLSVPVLTDQLGEGYEYYFVFKGEEPIGFFVIHPEEERLFLSKIYLYKDHRGAGNSSEIFDFLDNRAKELGLSKIYLTVNKGNTTPIEVYKHKGYKVIDSVVTDIGGGFVMDDYIMEKDLNGD